MSESMIEAMKSLCSEEWSNNACLGYLLLTCKGAEFSKKQTKELMDIMKIALDRATVDQARELYEASH